jgi:hypothetical protein
MLSHIGRGGLKSYYSLGKTAGAAFYTHGQNQNLGDGLLCDVPLRQLSRRIPSAGLLIPSEPRQIEHVH